MQPLLQITITIHPDGKFHVGSSGHLSDSEPHLVWALRKAEQAVLSRPQPTSPILQARGALPNGHEVTGKAVV